MFDENTNCTSVNFKKRFEEEGELLPCYSEGKIIIGKKLTEQTGKFHQSEYLSSCYSANK